MVIPIVCETPGCANDGEVINEVSEIAPENVDIFLEDYDMSRSSNKEDYCPICGQQGTAYEPEIAPEVSPATYVGNGIWR